MALDVYSQLDMLTLPTTMDIAVPTTMDIAVDPLSLLFMVLTALVYIARSAF